MRHLRRLIRALRDERDGISVTEYALLIAFVAVALVAVVQLAGDEIGRFVGRATCTISAYGGNGGGNNGGDNNTGDGNNGGDNNTGGGC